MRQVGETACGPTFNSLSRYSFLVSWPVGSGVLLALPCSPLGVLAGVAAAAALAGVAAAAAALAGVAAAAAAGLAAAGALPWALAPSCAFFWQVRARNIATKLSDSKKGNGGKK